MSSNVVFDSEDPLTVPRHPKAAPASSIIPWVIKHSGGLLKTPNQATYALIAFVVVGLLLSAFLIADVLRPVGNPDSIEILPAV